MPSLESPVAKVVRRVRSYPGASAALMISAAVGAAIFAVLIRWSANVYEAVANGDGVSTLDRPTLELAVSLRTPAGEHWVTAFTNLGSVIPMTFSTLAVIAAMYVRWRRRSIPLMMVIAATGSLIFTGVGKTVVGRARPPLELAVPPYEYAPSFPSGHTLNSTVIALMAAYLAWWLSKNLWVRVIAPVLGAVWAAAVGLSRVYLGHHWLTDVIFAWVIGLAWLTLLITVHRILLMLDSRDRRANERGGLPEQPPHRSNVTYSCSSPTRSELTS
jgi:undecaprenyl-diphosphatase